MQQLPICFVPVLVKERLPDTDGVLYPCLTKSRPMHPISLQWSETYKEWSGAGLVMTDIVTHWLEGRPNVIVCSKEELQGVFHAGKSASWDIDRATSRHQAADRLFREYLESKGLKP